MDDDRLALGDLPGAEMPLSAAPGGCRPLPAEEALPRCSGVGNLQYLDNQGFGSTATLLQGG